MKKKIYLIGALTVVLIGVLLCAYISFNRNVSSHLKENASVRLQEIVKPNVISFDLQMNEQIKKVNTLADILSNTGTLGDESNQVLLRSAAKHNGLLRCALAFPDGAFITHDNKNEGNVTQEAFFQANMKGEFFITDPRPAVVDPSKTVILFSAPIQKDNQVRGSLIYSYLCDDMDKIFNLNFLDGQGQMLVTKQDGMPLIGKASLVPQNENVIEYLRANCTHKTHDPAQCIGLTGDSGSTTITFSNNNDPLLVNFERLQFNDWYMLSMVPEKASAQTLSYLSTDQRNFTVVAGGAIAIYLILLGLIWLSQRNNVDKLTGALTLERFKPIASKILRRACDQTYVFVKLDIKNFKLINRLYNYEEGDRVIKNVASALEFVLSDTDSAYCRSEIDTFIFLLPYTNREALDAKRAVFIAKFRALMGDRFKTLVEFPTGQYVLSEEDMKKPDIAEILEKVNFAHRAAKQRDWGLILDYADDFEKEALLEKQIEDQMSSALTNEHFQLYLQPKFRTSDETICGAEALVRWEVNGKRYMHPTAFIPILERNGFIVKMDMYMFEQSVKRIREYMDEGLEPVTVSVNFSRLHLYNERFVEDLGDITDQYGVPRKYLEIELTETAVFENLEMILTLIEKLHAAGFTLSMDDFGSGYSCLALLKDLKVDVLKLDRGFFLEGADPKRSKIIIADIMRLAKDIEVVTVAEGIETREQVDMLKELQCDIIQGFYFAEPILGKTLDLKNPESYKKKGT